MNPETLPAILNGLADESRHFWLAFCAGALVYWWTSIILPAFYWGLLRLTYQKASMAAVYIMLGCCLLSALAAGLLSHYFLDFFSTWYIKPLGPHLELIKP